MDYMKLNKATRNDHFPLLFIDQMFHRLVGKQYYCFLDGYSCYNQIAIAPEDHERLYSPALMELLLSDECPLVYAMLQ